jgi:hypothetical protein
MKKLTLVVYSILRDGGTEVCYEVNNPDKPYYIDNRIGSKTIGKIFDRYPGDSGANMLNIKYTVKTP